MLSPKTGMLTQVPRTPTDKILIVLLMKIFMNLQCMKSINLILKTDKRHCMPHLYIHATLYSTYRLVVPYFGNDREDPMLMTFLFLKLSKSACERNDYMKLRSETIFSCNSQLLLQIDEIRESKQQCIPILFIGSDSYS